MSYRLLHLLALPGCTKLVGGKFMQRHFKVVKHSTRTSFFSNQLKLFFSFSSCGLKLLRANCGGLRVDIFVSQGYFALNFKKTSASVLSSICLGWLTNILIASRFLTISFLFPVHPEMPGLHQKSLAFGVQLGWHLTALVHLCKANRTCCL